MKKYFKIAVILLITLAFAGSTVLVGHAQKPCWVTTIEKKDAKYTWMLQTTESAGDANIALAVLDCCGNPVKGLQVTGELWMPEMKMEGYPMEFKFDISKCGQKHFAQVRYAHGGKWQIIARFKDDKGQLFEQSFDLKIKH